MLHQFDVGKGPIQNAGPFANVRCQDVTDGVRAVRFGGSVVTVFGGPKRTRVSNLRRQDREREDREEEKKREMKNYDKTTIAKEALLSVVFWIAGFIVVAIMNGSNLQQLIIS